MTIRNRNPASPRAFPEWRKKRALPVTGRKRNPARSRYRRYVITIPNFVDETKPFYAAGFSHKSQTWKMTGSKQYAIRGMKDEMEDIALDVIEHMLKGKHRGASDVFLEPV